MSQKRTKRISVTKYRKIVMDKGVFRQGRIAQCRKNYDVWENIYKVLPPEEEHNKWFSGVNLRNYLLQKPKNHPLVEKGIAFWLNENTLITGYRLQNNPQIYRPIFQIWKERLNFELRDDIRKYAKFLVAHKRQMLYEKTLMDIPELKILPEEIINMIAYLTYDPFSYLKL